MYALHVHLFNKINLIECNPMFTYVNNVHSYRRQIHLPGKLCLEEPQLSPTETSTLLMSMEGVIFILARFALS